MARLTNAIRDQIVKAIVKHTFRVRAAWLEREEKSLAIKIRDDYLGVHKKAYLALPSYLQKNAACIRVELRRLGENNDHHVFYYHPTMSISPSFGCEPSRWNHAASMHGPKTEPTGEIPGGLIGQDLDKKLYEALIKYADKFDQFSDDVDKLTVKINEQLRACTTTEKLVKEWPEVVNHIPAATNPLAVQIDRVRTNKMIECMESGTCK
jgi:hypothetical protein